MSESSVTKTPILSDSTYMTLKHTASIVLPAFAALYIGLAQFWHFPKPEEVAGSIALVNTFLGALVALSTKSYNNSDTKYVGKMMVNDSGERTVVQLQLNDDVDARDVLKMPAVSFKVQDTGETPVIKGE
jgi:hypothetical protein